MADRANADVPGAAGDHAIGVGVARPVGHGHEPDRDGTATATATDGPTSPTSTATSEPTTTPPANDPTTSAPPAPTTTPPADPTTTPPPSETPAVPAPGEVSEVKAWMGGGSGEILVTWNEIPDASGYRVYRSTSPDGPFSAAASFDVATGATTVEFSEWYEYIKIAPIDPVFGWNWDLEYTEAITSCGPIYFKVAAFDAAGEGPRSRRRVGQPSAGSDLLTAGAESGRGRASAGEATRRQPTRGSVAPWSLRRAAA